MPPDRKTPRSAPPRHGGWRATEYRRATSAGPQKSGGLRRARDVRCVLSSQSKSEHAIGLKTEQDLADCFEMRLAALILLDHGVDIAEARSEEHTSELHSPCN